MKLRINYLWLPWGIYFILLINSVVGYYLSHASNSNNDDPLLFGTVAAVLWVERSSLIASVNNDKKSFVIYGSFLIILGLFIYVIGSLSPVIALEVWAYFILASGMVLAMNAKEKWRSAAFIGISGTVLVFMGRIAPEMLSSTLAVNIASASATILNYVGFYVVANGVKLYFGPYTAEVTHACSGMNSIFSLLALCLLYLREGVERKIWHILILLLLAIPIAIFTNMLRVIMLVLTTSFLGNSFSQGLFHDFAGIIVFIIALTLMFLIDQMLININNSSVKIKNGKK